MSSTVSRRATLLVVCAAHFLMPFMVSAVGVALPSIGREFGASALQLGLVETTYVLSASIFLLAMGRLGDIHGRRRIFLLGSVLFTLVGGLLSQAWSIETVIGLRFLQGMGGSMVMATAIALVVSVYPPEERGRALGIAVASVYLGISCGPFFGGLLVTAFGWRSLFYLCLPLGATVFLIAWRRLAEDAPEAGGEPFDWPGSLVYAGAIILLIGGASNLERGGWAWGLGAAGIAGLAVFVTVESRTRHPLLDIAMLRQNRLFALSCLAALFNYAATFGVTFYFSLYLQYLKSMTASEAGAVLITQPLVQTLLSPFCGRLADRYPAARVASVGMAFCACGLLLAAGVDAGTRLGPIMAMLALLGLGFALFSSPNTSAIMGSVEPRHLGIASGMVGTMRTLGMMVSMTIITVILSFLMSGRAVTEATHGVFLHSMHLSLLAFCLLCLVGTTFSLARLRRR